MPTCETSSDCTGRCRRLDGEACDPACRAIGEPARTVRSPDGSVSYTIHEQVTAPRPRWTVTAANGRRIVIHEIDILRALPAYEALARRQGLPVDHVFSIVHEGAALWAATSEDRPQSGRYVVWMNVRARCGLHRLALFTHECVHVREGDCLRAAAEFGDGIDQLLEARCELEARKVVRAMVATIRPSAGGVSIDGDRCADCYTGLCDPCPQGADVFSQVNAALAPL